MNKKIQIISILSAIFLIMTFSGCDWCSCCKKETSTPKIQHPAAPEAKAPAVHPEPVEPPHMMPEHPIMPKMATPMPEEPETT